MFNFSYKSTNYCEDHQMAEEHEDWKFAAAERCKRGNRSKNLSYKEAFYVQNNNSRRERGRRPNKQEGT